MFASRHFVSLVAFSLLTLSTGCKDASANGPDITTDLPQQQRTFCQAAGKGNLNDAVASLGSSGTFVAWHGSGSVRLREDGKTLAINFSPVCPDSNPSVTLEDRSGIVADSAFGRSLQATDFSAGMIVSGKFASPAGESSSLPVLLQLVSPAQFSQRSNNRPTSISNSASMQPPKSSSSSSLIPLTAQPSSPFITAHRLTDQQVQLCKLNDDFVNWQPPPQDSNPIKMAMAPPIKEPDWNGRLQNILGDGTFTNWNVNLSSFLVNDYQEISIFVNFLCSGGTNNLGFGITLSTNPVDRTPWPHIRSKAPPTDPKIGSEISNFLSTMKPRDAITVSGKIFYERRYLEHPLFLTTHLSLSQGRSTYAATGFIVHFDKMSK